MYLICQHIGIVNLFLIRSDNETSQFGGITCERTSQLYRTYRKY